MACRNWVFLVKFWEFYLIGLMLMKTIQRSRKQKGRLVLFEVRHSSFLIFDTGIHQESLKKLPAFMFFHESVIFLLQQVVVDLEVSAANKDQLLVGLLEELEIDLAVFFDRQKVYLVRKGWQDPWNL
ncbi:hypothetical protein Patl1_30315 [Pistacia atlantica]|uniref:Uncharacterized protein n=1 Tax=Pistacia atlantica TaxID=434234 RepID=A0ACC1ACH9_9ROSI|nr:hypothetical protein Patl1_30315 [Pistacia atlantica]